MPTNTLNTVLKTKTAKQYDHKKRLQEWGRFFVFTSLGQNSIFDILAS